MNQIFMFFAIFFLLIGFCGIQAYRYRNPYKLIMIFGKKGSGKTTLLTKIAFKHIKRGQKVYSTVKIPGTYFYDVQNIGRNSFPRNSVILIDEVGMIWDNRNFKAFRIDVRDWFKLQRHYHNTVYMFSQTFDVDVKLRVLCDAMYLCRCHMGFISVARKIRRDIMIVEPTGDTEARIADTLEYVPLWMSLFGAQSIIFTYIPNWVKFFDSFEAPELPPITADYLDIPDKLRKKYGKRAA